MNEGEWNYMTLEEIRRAGRDMRERVLALGDHL
jgi:hypothetical protein